MKTESIKVEVSVGNQKFYGDGTKKVYETPEDILSALQTNPKDIIDHVNYSIDLGERATIRAKVLADPKVAGFAAFEKQVKDLMKVRQAANKPISEDQARKMIELLQTMEAPQL